MAKRDVGVICSMTYHEIKIITCGLSRIILENEVRGENTKKRIFALIGKLNNMLTKQCTN
jgi:hypothetical protein